ncbi:hypothetical protein T09_4541 [Trichinella sp. T9]|nr:hypothetical protein T09_4541 [Trichinella sp. T9]
MAWMFLRLPSVYIGQVFIYLAGFNVIFSIDPSRNF